MDSSILFFMIPFLVVFFVSFTCFCICICKSYRESCGAHGDIENVQRQELSMTHRPPPQRQSSRFQMPMPWRWREDDLPSYLDVTSPPSYISTIYDEKSEQYCNRCDSIIWRRRKKIVQMSLCVCSFMDVCCINYYLSNECSFCVATRATSDTYICSLYSKKDVS